MKRFLLVCILFLFASLITLIVYCENIIKLLSENKSWLSKIWFPMGLLGTGFLYFQRREFYKGNYKIIGAIALSYFVGLLLIYWARLCLIIDKFARR